ncbi:hypothetical protein AVEN_182829-1 [Araneus ventricosus]|uniref:DUF19 domain-containing protein n=1 Tax=Araneus ventricosus TaxID=182803 RepID=A0A4Y2NFE3_ARAVE|nr:hypothetical protein AVEN_182829-1 [Araneus ventricosus]
MKRLTFFAFGALYVFASGDTQCFKERSLECNRQLQNEFLSDFSFCSLQKRVIGCLTKPAIDCDLKFKSLAEKVDSVVGEMCTKGSKLYEELDKNKECIMKGITDRECLEPVMHILEKGTSPKDILKVQKETCRHLDQMTSCTVGKVRNACSEHVVTFFRSLYDPAIELHQRFCEEVILPENEDTFTTKRSEKTALPSFFGPLEFII